MPETTRLHEESKWGYCQWCGRDRIPGHESYGECEWWHRTDYLGTADLPDGYSGSIATVHICQDGRGVQYGVQSFGWFTLAREVTT
jgi:hypothetical protein